MKSINGRPIVTTKIFIHGLESSNQGTKSVYFRERFPDMIIPNFAGPLTGRMEKLDQILLNKTDIRLVGSSFGGLMASIFAMAHESRVNRLVLLAPAINYLESSGFALKPVSVPVSVYHGRNDDVIPLKDVKDTAEKFFEQLTFHAVDDDHFLHQTFKTIDWARYLN